MYTWSNLKRFDGKTIKPLERKKYTNILYGKYVSEFRKAGTSLGEYIMKKILRDCERNKIIITRNKFPYDVADNILHLTIWINPMFTVSADDVRAFIRSHGIDNFILFDNIPAHKSIKNIDHYHLFIRPADYSDSVIAGIISPCF